MMQVEGIEAIRRAYYVEGRSIREIAQRQHCGRRVVRKAIQAAQAGQYTLKKPRGAPVLAEWKARIDELLAESGQMPRKQRYTGQKIYQLVQAEGYRGSAGTVRRYIGAKRGANKSVQAYLPLCFEPGEDAQVDWGEAQAHIGGEQVTVQMFVMHLNYSHARFVMAFPFQKQEAFFEGHIQAFRFFGGVPKRITYDNLKTAVYRILSGHNRQEQQSFVTFRSYYLFESRYCTPAQGHEKGGVESDVGYAQRNFFAPLPQAASFEALNTHLRHLCRQDMQRRVRGAAVSVAQHWQAEQSHFLPLPALDYAACSSKSVKANPYSQVVFETNRYSVPVKYVGQSLVLRAYPFRIEVLSQAQVITSHPRCLGREQDVLDPLHYLPLLMQRPGAFEHALPLRRWRSEWPAAYERLLQDLLKRWPDGRGLREFLAILNLHRQHEAAQVEQAIVAALELGASHFDGVQLCLRQLCACCATPPPALDLGGHPHLAGIGQQAVTLQPYDRLLRGG